MHTQQELLSINPKDFYNVSLSESDILGFFHTCDAVWVHDDNPQKPHAELTTGLCSNGYFNCRAVLRYPRLCEILAIQLHRKLSGKVFEPIDWVIGSPYSAITLSYEVAKLFGAKHGFTEKVSGPDGKKMVWKEGVISENSVLQVEELITTGDTFGQVYRSVQDANDDSVNFLPFVGCIVHRPQKLPANYKDVQVISLVEREIWSVEQDQCPLCKRGSKRLRPKNNWAELTSR